MVITPSNQTGNDEQCIVVAVLIPVKPFNRDLLVAVFLFGTKEIAMRTIIKVFADLLDRFAARVSDKDITAAFWRIIFTLIRLAYLSMLLYWLLKLMEVFHKIGII